MAEGRTQTVRKSVIAAAGFGTRFLPQTKAMPKEMLPIVDKPIIQHVVEELVDSGITDIIIVTNYHKRIIEDHFDAPNAELASVLESAGKQKFLDELNEIPHLANIAYVRQKRQLGNIGPLYYAQDWVGQEPFIYTWSDDFIVAKPLRFKQMIDAYEKYNASIVSCVEVNADADYDKYGIVAGVEVGPGVLKMNKIIEKPGKLKAPSNLASVSGYLFKPEIFPYVNSVVKSPKRQGDTQTPVAIQGLINHSGKVLALKIRAAKYYDAGDKLEYLKTVVDFALEHGDIKDEFAKYLRARIS